MRISIEEYELPHIDSGPYGITTGKDGALWFTQHKANQIGRMTVDGILTHIDLPTVNAGVLSIVTVKTS